ncbi:MAG: formate dehydrogenase accessory sulfurtransferase FdhD [Gemmatimonadales bacterium]|nr:formate dehydrogenase accessory sulfurtransferase FdhD [Gemmatimonadales bacterium]
MADDPSTAAGPEAPLVHPHALRRLGRAAPLTAHPAMRWRDGEASACEEQLAEETPVTLVYNAVPHVVMMLTPADLEAFALGFSYTEGLITSPDDVREVTVVPHSRGIDVNLTVGDAAFAIVEGRARRMSGRTGCGVCGTDNVDSVLRPLAPVGPGVTVRGSAIHRALDGLEARQALNAAAHAVHAAGWADPSGELRLAREDVGRHNALDKLIGALLLERADPQAGFLVITSRASFEMVHKAASFGTGLLAAVGGATALAVRLAHASRLTLAGFVRRGGHVVYSWPERVT